MNFYLQQQSYFSFFAFFLGIVSFICVAANYAESKKTKNSPPQAAGSWPIIGHLHLLGGTNELPHRTLGAMADKYGPIFSIRAGIHPTVVVSDWKLIKECFTTNDKAFLTRPKFLAAKIMAYDYVMLGVTPYGQYWRDMRKLVMVELLSNRRIELLKHVRNTEVSLFIKELHKESVKNGGEVEVEMKERFGDLAMNIIVRMVAGKRYFGTNADGDQEESRRCQKALGDFFHLFGLFFASDGVPFLGWLVDLVKGHVGAMKRTARELNGVFGRWVDEHRAARVQGRIKEEEQGDFIHVMLSKLDDDKRSAHDIDTVIKANCLSIILGGNDTTVATLTWTLSLLLNNRKVLRKAQQELDTHVGEHRQVQELDIKNLVYLQAIIKEAMRLYPALPLSVQRESIEDCNIAGFHVPAGTRLLVNIWKLHRDPSIWSDPLEFRPERFLMEQAKLDFRGQDFVYIPFGSGRRMCPGVSLAINVVSLALARLLHGFELGTPSDTRVDMTESPGLSVPKATPLRVVVRPKLCSELYKC